MPLADIDGLVPERHVLRARAEVAHSAAQRGNERARRRAPASHRPRQHAAIALASIERRWQVGETLIFDDTIEHEARNDSDELRVVLIFDLWNPLLIPTERELVRTMTAAARAFASTPRSL